MAEWTIQDVLEGRSAWAVAVGDCLEVLPTIPRESIDLCATSPPYAMQREEQYGGISEADFPDWTVEWMNALPLRSSGSVLINIREHVRDGQLSDYVHRTRMAVRAAGWIECDELIWNKPDSAPLGDNARPRRSWERILWFSRDRRAFCNPIGNGKPSDRIGWDRAPVGWISSQITPIKSGIGRHTDVCTMPVCKETFGHPATYPIGLALWMIRGWCPDEGVVCDPFTGSGQTAMASLQVGRSFIGCELNPDYASIARRRIAEAANTLWTPAAPKHEQVEMFKEQA